MEIYNHPACTTSIGAPSDMPEDCSALPCLPYTDQFGAWVASFWMPSAEELALLNAGMPVVLHVRAAGRQHPVVGINVASEK